MVAREPDLTGVLLEGRYRVGELLAVGGMSRVYRGTDTRLDRAVAIKVMQSALAADPAFRRRLEREARAMARIDHPGVVDVYDQGEHGGAPEPNVYLVMELVDGGTLRDVLAERGSLELPEALAVLEPVLAALAAAHREGLTHRDVKPENVLISRTGTVKVADFGLVTAAAQARTSTVGMILGTVAYLSPEQVASDVADARSDVYAVGVMLYELLTGVPPYDGDHALAVAYRHVNSDVPAPSELVPELPPELDALVGRATRRDPEQRPADAETLLYAVRGIRAALRVPAVPVPIPRARAAGAVPVPAGAAARAGDDVPSDRIFPDGGPGPRTTRAMTHAGWPATHRDPAPTGPAHGLAERVWRRRRDRRILAASIGALALLGILVAMLGWGLGAGHWVPVPTVLGLDRTAAERMITEAGLVPAVEERHHDVVPAGIVAGSTPSADVEVPGDSSVTLTVSTGRPRVPSIPAGTPAGAAEELLRAADLVPRQAAQARRYHPTAPEGTVIGTDPKAGTELTVSAPVTLVLSAGPAPDLVDKVGGSLADSIQRRIEDALRGGR